MPSRKQRRRRQKERRHEYEYVYVDEEGNEVEVEPEHEGDRFEVSRNGKRGEKARVRTPPGGRRIEPPSWRRVGKRAVVLAPIMFLTLTLLGGDLTLAQRTVQTLYLIVLFVPFSYFLDRLLYRRYVSRAGGQGGAKPQRR